MLEMILLSVLANKSTHLRNGAR